MSKSEAKPTILLEHIQINNISSCSRGLTKINSSIISEEPNPNKINQQICNC